ncbi:MAG TPA: ankyrin repeat domain-containing protein [Vicinamibacterales bacterium]|nr:ankyrin repeat domain-containing protein [Vicinamibacterales bacterium]
MRAPALSISNVLRAGATAAVAVALAVSLHAGQATSLFDAVRSGDAEAIRSVLDRHPDVNAREADGTTALHWAVRGNDLPTVRALLRAGAKVNATNRYDVTPLALAAANGEPAMIAALLDAGADVNTTTPSGETVLMTASRTGNPDAVKLLLDRGADASAREQDFGENAIMWAAAENHAAVVRLLAGHGADLDAPANVLHFPNVKVDAATMVITALPKGGLTPLMYAARQGSLEAARTLAELGANLNATDPDGMSAIVIAIINAHYGVAKMLAEKGADPNVADASGMAAVYAAVDMHTMDPLTNRPSPRGNTSHAAVDLVATLLAHGANANAGLKAPLLPRQHNFGDAALGAGATPLMRAARSGDVEMLNVLLDHGADVNRAMSSRMTALLFASTANRRKSPHDALAAAKICVEHGADVNAQNAAGESALHLAVSTSDDLVRYLAEHGARLDVKDRQGRTPLDIALGVGTGGRGRGGVVASPVVHESAAALLRQLAAGAASPATSTAAGIR